MPDRDDRRRDEDDEDDDRPRRRRRRDDDYEDEDDDYDDRPRRRQSRDLGDDPAMRLVLPVGTSGWAIASGYLGLVSVLCLPGPFAVLTGILAIRHMKRNPKVHGMGRAVFGIVMGSVATLAMLFFLVAAMMGKVR